MSTIIDLMLAIRDNNVIFYHKDTNEFDFSPLSQLELAKLDPNARLPRVDTNNIQLPSSRQIDHKDIMSFYVRENVEDKEIRKQLFSILRRHEYMGAYLEKLRELDLYDDFIDACGDVYYQIFHEWAEKNGLDFSAK